MIYHKVEFFLENNIPVFNRETFSWGHGREQCDEVFFDDHMERCIFKTKIKENIPENIEELLVEKFYQGYIDNINKKKQDIEYLEKYINQKKKILNYDIFNNINRKLKLNSL